MGTGGDRKPDRFSGALGLGILTEENFKFSGSSLFGFPRGPRRLPIHFPRDGRREGGGDRSKRATIQFPTRNRDSTKRGGRATGVPAAGSVIIPLPRPVVIPN